VASLILLTNATLMAERHHKSYGDGFSFEIDSPYEEVLTVVREEVAAGIIHGTREYTNEEEVSGATPGKVADPFPAWRGEGEALYLSRTDTLAPAHFKDSADVGTLILRYLVQPSHTGTTHIDIHAAFVESAGHHHHPSDGTVEVAEFTEIVNKIKSAEAQRAEDDRRKKGQAEENRLAELHRLLNEEDTALRQEKEEVRQLSLRADQLRVQTQMQVKEEFAVLRAEPFAAAEQVEALQQHEVVTVLQRTPFWYHVRTQRNSDGWLHYLSLIPITAGTGD
jgi:hypothetical protein